MGCRDLHSLVQAVLVLTSTALASLSYGADEQRLRVDGVWQDGRLHVHRVRERDPEVDRTRVRVVGRIEEFDTEQRRLCVGPVTVFWNTDQVDLLRAYALGATVEIDAHATVGQRLQLVTIETADIDAPDEVGIIGSVTGIQRESGADQSLVELAGIPVWVPSRLYSNGRIRLGRQDDNRPDQQLHAQLGSVELTIGGELEFKSDLERNRDLDDDNDDDRVTNEQAFQLETFVEFNDSISAFFEVDGDWSQVYDDRRSATARTDRLRRGETWLFFDQPFGAPIGIQLGRQNIADEREWWWDEDLDAARVIYRRRPVSFEIAYAKQLVGEEFGAEIPAEDDGVSWLIGTAGWDVSSELRLDAFFLQREDRSTRQIVGDVALPDLEDPDDSNLRWLGLRLQGDVDVLEGAELTYWIDTGKVTGTEIYFDFDDGTDDARIVSAVGRRERSGHAYDLGASLTWGRYASWEPSLTLGFAQGSGDLDASKNYRPTGLNNNNDRFNGVNRFRYYGELARPELVNLNVSTLSLGFRIGDSSLEIAHHRYTQVVPSTAHTLRVRPDANGIDRELGTEWDVILGLEEWTHWEIEIIGSFFSPGSAFDGADSRSLGVVKLNYNF